MHTPRLCRAHSDPYLAGPTAVRLASRRRHHPRLHVQPQNPARRHPPARARHCQRTCPRSAPPVDQRNLDCQIAGSTMGRANLQMWLQTTAPCIEMHVFQHKLLLALLRLLLRLELLLLRLPLVPVRDRWPAPAHPLKIYQSENCKIHVREMQQRTRSDKCKTARYPAARVQHE